MPATVTILFKDAPKQSGTTRFGGSLHAMPEGTIVYVDSTLNRIYYTPRNIGYDTLVIPAPFGYAEIYHRNQAIENIHYLLIAGDTVLFSYGENLRPRLKSLRSDWNTWLYNLPYDDSRAIQSVGYSTQTILNDVYYKIADKVMHQSERIYATDIQNKYRKYYISLDSLRPIWETCQSDMLLRFDSLEANGVLPSIYADYCRRQVKKPDLVESKAILSDSMMHYISHFSQVIASQYQMAPKGARSTERFDTIAADTSLSPTVRKAILNDIMSLIENGDYWKPYPTQVVQQYRDRYRQITGDSTFCITVVNKGNLIVNGYSTDLVLQGLDGKQYAYEDILNRYRDNVIYVDIWASWCGPCRAGMATAKTLREEYSNQKVVFLYLAINDEEGAWCSAVRSCQTDYLGENYRILNAGESQFLKQIKHTRIPHLLLYDREGRLVDPDAPQPKSQEIRNLINSYL